MKKIKQFSYGFALAEILIVLTILGVVFTFTIGSLNVNHKKAVNNTKYKKIYENLDYATKTANITPTGLKVAFTSNPAQVLDVISKQMPKQEKFDGCKFSNLEQLVGAGNCTAQNVKGAVLSDGTSISFVSANVGPELQNNLINNYGKSLKKGSVGVLIINNNSGTLDSGSIIPVYEDGLGPFSTEENPKDNILSVFTPKDDTTKSESCNAIDHVWLDGKCQTPSRERCLAIDKALSGDKCVQPTKELCAESELVLAENKCQEEDVLNNEYAEKYREIFAALRQAYADYKANETPKHLGGNNYTNIADMFEKYLTGDMRVISKSGLLNKYNNGNGFKTLAGKNWWLSRQGGIVLANGASISIGAGHPHWIQKPTLKDGKYTCPGNWVGDYNGSLYIDVNGENQGPNVFGRDIYYVFSLHDDIYPWPLDEAYSCAIYCDVSDWTTPSNARKPTKLTCNLNDSIGYGCAAWFLEHDKYDQ